MKGFRSVFAALILVFFFLWPRSSSALELQIQSGLFALHYLYASQMGARGFFGPYDTDMSSKRGDYASLNGWFRRRLVSGTTGLMYSNELVIFPVLKINEAVSVHGTYRVGFLLTDNVADRRGTGTPRGIAEARRLEPDDRWTRLWVQVNSPLGRIYYGKKWFRQACGLQFGAGRTAEEIEESARRAEEILQIEAFTGPLTIGAGFYPWRRGSRQYWNTEDQNTAQVAHLLAYARYAAGPLESGFGGFYSTFNQGPEAERTQAARESAVPSNTTATEGWLYLKFSNGYFFFNTELDWYYRTIRYQKSQDGTFNGEPDNTDGSGSKFAPQYVESWRFMSDFGVFSGPTKVSFLVAHMPGPDRRHGILIKKQPYIQDPERSAYGVFYPYCLLMAKVYGAGVNSFRDMSSSNVVAALVNYMPASNLDVYASFMYARRSSQGYSWGYVRPNPSTSRFGRVNFGQRGSYQDPTAAIPDNDLGWEADLGVTWNLLENWQLRVRGAYWRPGKWFNYACVDKSVQDWDKPSSANNFGVNPNRTIDPVLGLELWLNARF